MKIKNLASLINKSKTLELYSPDEDKPGDKILDTHLGSGSSRIAAYDMGFEFVGTEIDPDYFKAQEERFMEHTAQGSLFI